MVIRPVVVMLCAAGFLGARSVSAQGGVATHVASAAPAVAAATVVLVDGKPIGAAEPWGARPAGSYGVVLPMADGMMLADLSIADSAGKLVAKLRPNGADHVIAMDAAVNGTDLVLSLKREHGPIRMHLQHRGPNISGNWIVAGMDSGTLEGVAKQ